MDETPEQARLSIYNERATPLMRAGWLGCSSTGLGDDDQAGRVEH